MPIELRVLAIEAREHDVDRAPPAVSPLARMQGRSSGTIDDASVSSVDALAPVHRP